MGMCIGVGREGRGNVDMCCACVSLGWSRRVLIAALRRGMCF